MQRRIRMCGIDPGSHTLKLAYLPPGPGHQGVPDQGVVGPGVDLGEGEGRSPAALAAALRELCRESGLPFRGARAAVALPAAATVSKSVYLPPLGGGDLRSALYLEMERLLPFSPDEGVGDYLPMAPRLGEGGREERGYLLLAARHEEVQHLSRGFKLARLRLTAVEPEPATLYRLALLLGGSIPDADLRPRVLVDLGAGGTRLVVVRGPELLLYRDIPVGGRHLTQALADQQGLSLADAEAAKRTDVRVDADIAAFGHTAERLRSELERSLRYVEREQGLEGYAALHLVGGGAQGTFLRMLVERAVGIAAQANLGPLFGAMGPVMAKAVALALWHRRGGKGARNGRSEPGLQRPAAPEPPGATAEAEAKEAGTAAGGTAGFPVRPRSAEPQPGMEIPPQRGRAPWNA